MIGANYNNINFLFFKLISRATTYIIDNGRALCIPLHALSYNIISCCDVFSCSEAELQNGVQRSAVITKLEGGKRWRKEPVEQGTTESTQAESTLIPVARESRLSLASSYRELVVPSTNDIESKASTVNSRYRCYYIATGKREELF